ncbi:MAG: UDP-N-acetyl-D-glucosamine dehydrogenase [Solirubrobacteraceae bacterium]|nr:UDP-N-acetyl-D-glucosamine dehydrogenase [Solirubrobacteraceae bacterium]
MTQILSGTAFDERIAARTARVGIVGLGYAGLPLAMAFAEAGFGVVGIDISAERVAAVSEGRSYLVDVPADRYAGVDGRLEATSDYSAVSGLDALTICVPTPLSKTRTPDLSYVVAAAEAVAEQLAPGQLVILQSTTYPGTTEQVIRPILEQAGAVVGTDIFLGYAPERVDPGNRQWDVHTTPKLVAGVTDECRRRTKLLYETIVDTVVPVSSPMVAETAKLHENTFRAVNIALANELALMCNHLGISAWEVIEAASSKPFGFLAHYPGPGLGGDCIPVVPHFLSWRLREYGYSAQLIDAAAEVNASMPNFVLQKIADALNDRARPIRGSRILLLGVTYKADVADTRESPSLEVLKQLASRGADVRYCDPHIPELELEDEHYASVEWTDEEVRAADCVVMLAQHREFLATPRWDQATLVVDTRNVVPPAPHVVRI